ncbi:E1 [Tadarida brasiliensis papillomavirus 2]|nr:E1 [Tadarida brasiliensis papillomavirus 2]
MAEKGTSEDWCLFEAECSDKDDEGDLESLFDHSDDGTDFVDDASIASSHVGDHAAVFQNQQVQEDLHRYQQLKRKLLFTPSPKKDLAALSPRLQAVSLSVQQPSKVKKQLFGRDETPGPNPKTQVVVAEIHPEPSDSVSLKSAQTSRAPSPAASAVKNSEQESQDVGTKLSENDCLNLLLKAKNRKAFLYLKFKEETGLGFCDMTRDYKSDKTFNNSWVIFLYALREECFNAMIVALKQISTFYCGRYNPYTMRFYGIIEFVNQKCREGIEKFLKGLIDINVNSMLSNPPKYKCIPLALYWYKQYNHPQNVKHGDLPEWINKQLGSQFGENPDPIFSLTKMIQWAYDNEFLEDHQIAYNYAQLAEEDENALAFLNNNNQAKLVRDCGTMVRLYKKAEMKSMSMDEWITKMCRECPEPPDNQAWRRVIHFLRNQGIEFFTFMPMFKNFLKHKPKHCTIVLTGPSDTGKSYFANGLVKFLRGRVVSFANSASHFWLSPFADCKIGLIDDLTKHGWRYCDIHLRNGLDGHPFCLDAKYKAPQQTRLPPTLITTNEDIEKDPEFKFLVTRLNFLHFTVPITSQTIERYSVDDSAWRSFFYKFQQHLELNLEEEGEDEQPKQSLKLCAGRNTEFV